MTSYQHFDPLLVAAARQVFREAPVPYADLWEAAQLGFDASFGRATLAHHAWLAFLNRLWDARRTAGAPDGPVRVPDRIWILAWGDDDGGRLHRELLEATGLLLPDDFGQELSFHLTLWSQELTAGAVRGCPGVPAQDQTTYHALSIPAAVDVSASAGGFRVELCPDLPGRYSVTLHWADGDVAGAPTPRLAAGQTCTFDLATRRREPPVSVLLTREALT